MTHGYLTFNKIRTGNSSTGSSTFAMLVLENELSKVHLELDMVTIPGGDLVAMSHANNCTTEINEWMNVFAEVLKLSGGKENLDKIYTMLFKELSTKDPQKTKKQKTKQ